MAQQDAERTTPTVVGVAVGERRLRGAGTGAGTSPVAGRGASTRGGWSLVLALLLVAGLVGTPQPASAQELGSTIDVDDVPGHPDPARRLQRLVNAERAAAGLAPLRWNATLQVVAAAWSDHMVEDGRISHRPDLAEVVTSRWRRLGENVGVGPDVDDLHVAFMASPRHRRNVMGEYDQIGVAVVIDRNRTWVTANFGSGTLDATTVVGRGTATTATPSRTATGSGSTAARRDGTVAVVAGRGGRFLDVPVDGVHARGIESIVAAGISAGCGGGRFCGGRVVTRAQMASFVASAAGLSPGAASTLGDVPDGSPHTRAIAAVRAAGLLAPCAAGRFCPTEPVTRGEMAGILTRLLGLDDPAPTARFVDVGDPALADEAARLAAAGVTSGCAAQRYCPTRTVTRGQMASLLARALQL